MPPLLFMAVLTAMLSFSLHAPSAWGHGGNLDKYGCHHDRKHGGYHCHKGAFPGRSFASQMEMIASLQQSYTALPPTLPVQPFTGTVVAVEDGDTISVMHVGKAEKVRLHGIDCPEIGQAFGKKAQHFTADLVYGKEVTIQAYGHDRYGRTIGEVLLADGTNVNHALVQAGLAWWYRKYSDDQRLGSLEAEARGAKRGLWVELDPTPPWCYRSRQKGQGC